jgi:peptidoglycan/xylan/chitin deacetylase (PgdA/CDA1 family)
MIRLKHIIISIFLISPLFGDSYIFLLHRFDDSRYQSTNISTDKLREHFKLLKDSGYKVVSLKYLLSHKDEDDLVAFTIDDGYKSFYENGLKLFREFNYPFTLFIYTEAIDNRYPDFMNWTQVKRASQFGEIGIHSHSHPHLTHLTPIEIMKDTQKAIDSFKEEIGEPPRYYAYPYGEYSKDSKEIIEAFGFQGIFNQSIGAFDKNSDQFNIYRIPINDKDSLEFFLTLKYLQVEWFEPLDFPEDGLLRRVIAKVPSDIKSLELYVSGGSWREIKTLNGIVDYEFPEPYRLELKQNRIFLKSRDNRWGSHILAK